MKYSLFTGIFKGYKRIIIALLEVFTVKIVLYLIISQIILESNV